MDSAALGPVRAIGALHGIGGAVLTLRPAMVGSRAAAAVPAWVLRVLGVRLLLQSAAELSRPTAGTAVGSAAIELAHAGSMLPVLLTRTYRRPAAASALTSILAARALFGAACRNWQGQAACRPG